MSIQNVIDTDLSFDSILVRLKVVCQKTAFTFLLLFRFHTGSIKSAAHVLNTPIVFSFDSILVRLKVSMF